MPKKKLAGAAKRARGRRPFEPTEKDRLLVESHSSFGTPQEDICTLIINPVTKRPIDGKTLRHHFSTEILMGESRVNARVAGSLFHQAMGRPAQYDKNGNLLREELKPSVAAAIFWMKARAGWSDHRLLPPPPPRPNPEPRTEKLGKKAAQQAAAAHAGDGTDWGEDLDTGVAN